jgi:hypothetical protein
VLSAAVAAAVAAADAIDVYVPPRGAIKLLDCSPISDTTNPLCFEWEDLPYPHMKQQQQQQTSTSGQHPTQPPPQQEQEGRSSSSSSQQQQQSGSCSSSHSGPVMFGVVEHEGMIVPGARVATGMPYDMLGLPDAVNAVMTAMQQQQLQ